MALLQSKKISLGTVMPEFLLNDSFNKQHSLKSLMGNKGLLIYFTCNHCPYAVTVWPRSIRLAKVALDLGISTVAINPNIHPDYPQDSPENMKVKIKEWGISLPYLVDETQEVARAYDVQCTPDIYLLNSKRELVYHGRVDDNWQDESKVTRQELLEAVKSLAAGKPISSDQKNSMGCSIKWVG